jgi:hypothetical protein
VSAAVIGMPSRKTLEEDVRIAATFQPLGEAEMKEMAARLSAAHRPALERFFAAHTDA